MAGKITRFFREYILALSIILTILGLIVLFMGVIWYWARDVNLGIYTETIKNLQDWNAYLLVIGLIVFGIGVWYLYSYFNNKKFVLKELETNKRSEFLKTHSEVKDKVRRMPSKYKKMLNEKEKELKIK